MPYEGQKKIVILDTSSAIETKARDEAEARLTEDRDALTGVSGFFKRVWKHNLAREYYRQSEIERVRGELRGAGSVYGAEDTGRTYDERSRMATVERFMSGLIEANAGETTQLIADQNERIQVEEGIKNSIREYVRAAPADEAAARTRFLQERDRLLTTRLNLRTEDVAAGIGFADNLLQVAIQARDAHDLDLNYKIVIGRARMGVRTEAEFNTTDRIIEKLRSVGLSSVVNETVLSGAVAIAASTAQFFTTRFARGIASVIPFLGVATVGAGTAYIREHHTLEEERRQHAREMAQSKSFDAARAPRRQEMQQFVHDMRNASDLTAALRAHLNEDEGVGVGPNAIRDLAEVGARMSVSNARNVDLIRYANEFSVEEERFAMNQVGIALAERITSQGLGTEYERALAARTEELKRIDDELRQRERIFKHDHAKSAAWRGLGTGLLFGFVVQETVALASSSQHGVIEGIRDGWQTPTGQSETALKHLGTASHNAVESLHSWITGTHHAPGYLWSNADHLLAADHAGQLAHHVVLPHDVALHRDLDGTYALIRGNERLADHITFDDTGHPTAQSEVALRALGISTKTDIATHHLAAHTSGLKTPDALQASGGAGAPQSVSARDYLAQHPSETVRVHRDMWYDNDTVKPDKNELKIWWGGKQYSGYDDKGNYVFTVKKMFEGGSYHGGASASPHELLENHRMVALFSLSRDTQHTPLFAPIDTNGNIVIDPKSTIGKLCFEPNPAGGEPIFKGKFMEAAEIVGRRADGSVDFRPLATEVGKGVSSIPVQPPVSPIAPIAPIAPEQLTEKISTTVFNIPAPGAPSDWDLPPIIPIPDRYPLEPLRKERGLMYPYYGSGSAAAIRSEFQRRRIALDTYTGVQQGAEQQILSLDGRAVTRNANRERSRVEQYLLNQDPRYIAHIRAKAAGLPPMDAACRLAVIIPARFEARHLANLLEQYSKQVDESGHAIDPSLFEINILVNRKESEQADNSVAVVNQWKAAHPGVRINLIDEAFSDDRACVGLARKMITDISLLRSQWRQGEHLRPLYIQSEDADMFGIDKHLVAKTVGLFDAKPNLDLLRGVQDRQPEMLAKNDLLFFQRRLWDFVEVFLRNPKYRPGNNPQADFVWHRVVSGGWNTAFTAEVYAQIGGYNEGMRIGEDMDIGQKISVLRGSEDSNGVFTTNTWTAEASGLRSNSSPRRYIDALARNTSPYADFDNQDIKKASDAELMQRIEAFSTASEEHLQKYEDQINYVIGFLKTIYPTGNEWRAVLERALVLGIGFQKKKDYEINGERLTLKREGLERLIANLKKYKETERWKLGYRRQNSPLDITDRQATSAPESPAPAEVAAATQEAASLEALPQTEAERIMGKTEIHAHDFGGKHLTVETLRQAKLEPKYKVKLDGVEWYASQPYEMDSGRLAIVAYVHFKDKIIARTYYRSNSQGVWRYLPGYTGVGPNIDWFDKGYGEESVTVPIASQMALAKLVAQEQPLKLLPAIDPDLIFAGTSRKLEDYADNRGRRGITYYLESEAEAQKLNGNFYIPENSEGPKKMKPEEVRFTDANEAPDFTKVPLATWEEATAQYGNVFKEVLPSRDGERLYMFCRDTKGRLWIGGIENVASEIRSTGLKRAWVKGGDLTTPAYEYKVPSADQTGGYGNDADRSGPYVDMYANYLSKIPVFQEYKAALERRGVLVAAPAPQPVRPAPQPQPARARTRNPRPVPGRAPLPPRATPPPRPTTPARAIAGALRA